MVYVAVFIIGAAIAASALLVWYFARGAQLSIKSQYLANCEARLKDDGARVSQQSQELNVKEQQLAEQFAALDGRRQQIVQEAAAYLAQQNEKLETKSRQLQDAYAEFEARRIKYDDLLRESASLKQDLFNLSVQVKKTGRDQAAIDERQKEIAAKANELAERYLEENVSWIASKLNPRNFATSKDRLLKVIEACRSIGFDVPQEKAEALVEELKTDYEQAVRDEFAREEQTRIKAQIREEEKLAREVEKQVQEAERQQAAVQAALEKALKEAKDEHSAEVEHLRARLKEAEENAQRAKSMAQMTKAGHVYVISNIGSFGEGVFKIGMTRRLEPMERVRELGDASVPFPFDVHMMISCNDAPTLENALHRELHKLRLNKVNFRKEFFRVDFEAIRQCVEANHGQVDYVAEPAALDYREGLAMTDEDTEFVEHAIEAATGGQDPSVGDE